MFDADGHPRVFPKGRYRVDALTDFALEYLRTRRGDRPFFLFLSYIEPHHQNDHNRFEGPRGAKKAFKDFNVPGDLRDTAGDWRENYADYLGCCHRLDRNVGRIQDELTRLRWENTLLIYTSDHGCHFRTRNAEYKRSCHEASVHIPLIMHGPGFTGGSVQDALVSLLDLTPTVLRAGGVAPPAHMVGSSLQQLVAGDAKTRREAVLIQISEDHIGRAIRTPRWKYAVRVPSDTPWSGCAQPGSTVYTEECLYDLESDPFERHNLITAPELISVRRLLAEKLLCLMVEAGEPLPVIMPAP
jgi:uncharacterized sulfatase